MHTDLVTGSMHRDDGIPRIGRRLRCYFALSEPEVSAFTEDAFQWAAGIVVKWLDPSRELPDNGAVDEKRVGDERTQYEYRS